MLFAVGSVPDGAEDGGRMEGGDGEAFGVVLLVGSKPEQATAVGQLGCKVTKASGSGVGCGAKEHGPDLAVAIDVLEVPTMVQASTPFHLLNQSPVPASYAGTHDLDVEGELFSGGGKQEHKGSVADYPFARLSFVHPAL